MPELAKSLFDYFRQIDGFRRLPLRSTVLFSAGDPADRIFFLESGLVKILRRNSQDREVSIRIVRAGELFGTGAILPGSIRASYAVTLEESVICVVPGEAFRAFCSVRPNFLLQLTQMLAGRLEKLEQRIELLSLCTVEKRIVDSLLDLAEIYAGRAGTETDVTIPLPQHQMASLVGATRETTSTALNALARRGLVRLGRRRLAIPSLDALRNTVSGVARAHSA
jgi:CRP-like cAMP-binding protein